MFGKKLFAQIFAVLLLISLLIGTLLPQAVFAMHPPGGPTPPPPAETNSITVEKTFEGISRGDIPNNFTITVSKDGIPAYVLKDGTQPGNIRLRKSKNGLVWTWKISQAATGTYSVSENNTTISGYNLTSTGIPGPYLVRRASYEIGHILLTAQNNQVTNIDGDFIFAASLAGNLGTVVITPEALSQAQKSRIEDYLRHNMSGNWSAGQFYFHSIDSQGKTFRIWKNYGQQLTITYNAAQKTMTINNKSDWNHLALLTYTDIAAANAEIKIVNTYVWGPPVTCTTTTESSTTADTTITTAESCTTADTSITTAESFTTADTSITTAESFTTADTSITTAESFTTAESCTTADTSITTAESFTTADTSITTAESCTTADTSITTAESFTTEDTSITTVESFTTADTSISTAESFTTEDTSITTVESFTTEDTTEPTSDEQVAPLLPLAISVKKLVGEESFTKAGDELHYSFTLMNDGIAPVVKLTVNDPQLGIDQLLIDLADDPLLPGDSYSYDFLMAYVVTEADLLAEKVVNKLTVIAESAEGASFAAEADVTTPREQILPLEPELPQTGEYTGYWTGIGSLILGGALVLLAINKRKKISDPADKAD